MKKLARLILFTFAAFFLLFAFCGIASFLRLWTAAAASVPVRTMIPLDEVIRTILWTLSLSLYGAVLLAMNYAQRNSIFAPIAFACVLAISGGMCFIAVKGLENARITSVAPFFVSTGTLGKAGLMLPNHGTVTILIDKPSLETGSRVVAAPEKQLVYEDVPLDENGALIPLPPVRFHQENTSFYMSLKMDFDTSAAYLNRRFNEGLIPFISWLVPLLVLLASLSYLFHVGAWPLANLFLCAVIYRGVLLFETFITNDSISAVLEDFSRGLVPNVFITPAVLALLSILVLIYDILMYFARTNARAADAGAARSK